MNFLLPEKLRREASLEAPKKENDEDMNIFSEKLMDHFSGEPPNLEASLGQEYAVDAEHKSEVQCLTFFFFLCRPKILNLFFLLFYVLNLYRRHAHQTYVSSARYTCRSQHPWIYILIAHGKIASQAHKRKKTQVV